MITAIKPVRPLQFADRQVSTLLFSSRALTRQHESEYIRINRVTMDAPDVMPNGCMVSAETGSGLNCIVFEGITERE